jgi:hypothetical protein
MESFASLPYQRNPLKEPHFKLSPSLFTVVSLTSMSLVFSYRYSMLAFLELAVVSGLSLFFSVPNDQLFHLFIVNHFQGQQTKPLIQSAFPPFSLRQPRYF